MSKDQLHELVDALPDNKVDAAADFLGYLVEKDRSRHIMTVLENAPEEGEMLDPEELEAIREAEEDIASGRVRPYREVKKELGL